MKTIKAAVAICCGLLAMTMGGSALAGPINIVAGYDDDAADNSYVTVTNNTDSTFSSITLSSSGDGGTDSTSLTDLLPGASTTYYFSGSAGLQSDYDDYYHGNNQTYTLAGMLAGQSVSAVFSPSLNATGDFLAFLGNDANGNEYDVTLSGLVAQIDAPAAVPEPASLALMGLGLAGLSARRRAKRS